MARPCGHCGASIGQLVETCPACGGFNRAERPFYIWLIGAAIVLMLILAFGDLSILLRLGGDLLRRLQ